MTRNPELVTKPFLKWPGGKRWLAKKILPAMKNSGYRHYYEPFLGGGAVFFALSPEVAFLSDVNGELIKTYKAVRNAPEALLARLREFEQSEEEYYRIRATKFTAQTDIAAQFLYLNRLCFAGMYRVNKHGDFNVPYGGRNADILWEQGLISSAAKVLKKASLGRASFEVMLKKAQSEDLVFCDPTYTVTHNDNGFIRYNEKVFHWEDQEKLASLCKDAGRRGVKVVVSNAAHPCISKLYHPYKPITVDRHTCVSRIRKGRKSVQESVFVINGNREHYKKCLLSPKWSVL